MSNSWPLRVVAARFDRCPSIQRGRVQPTNRGIPDAAFAAVSRYESAFSRHELPELCNQATLINRRAQGRPGARRPHGPRAKKNARGGHHRFGQDIPAFPARWLYGLYVPSPGDRRCCPRRPRNLSLSADLTSAPGGQDHTISPCVSRCSSASRMTLQPGTPTASRTQRS
jgi:hypothetical protein